VNPAAPLPTRRCALLLLPGGTALAAAGLLEALGRLNELQDEVRYEPVCLSLGEGAAALRSRPMRSEERDWFAFFVVGGDDSLAASPGLQLLLRDLVAAGVAHLGAVGSGSLCLARAGLPAGRRMTADWSLIDALRSDHPEVVWCNQVWEMDLARAPALLSCAGGASSLDLACAWAASLHGERAGQQLAVLLGLEQVRGREVRPRVPEQGGRTSAKLAEALALMEANLAEPLPTEEVARLVGVSRRQLERLFKQHLDSLPSRHYLELRLQRARRLLQHSGQSILQIGLSCGFSSGPHFSNAYKAAFGRTPREERSAGARAALPWRASGESSA
jgi:transcriptional regulator GlxA family with amidase domain